MTFVLHTPDVNSLHAEAVRAIVRGDDARALALYETARRAEPENPMHALRTADCLVRLRRTEKAVAVYRRVAEQYAASAHFTRAISVLRIVERLSPHDAATKQRLADFARDRDALTANLAFTAPREPVVPPQVVEMFPVVELAVDDPEVPAPKTADVVALEATVRDLLAELLRVQCELDAMKARVAAAEQQIAC